MIRDQYYSRAKRAEEAIETTTKETKTLAEAQQKATAAANEAQAILDAQSAVANATSVAEAKAAAEKAIKTAKEVSDNAVQAVQELAALKLQYGIDRRRASEISGGLIFPNFLAQLQAKYGSADVSERETVRSFEALSHEREEKARIALVMATVAARRMQAAAEEKASGVANPLAAMATALASIRSGGGVGTGLAVNVLAGEDLARLVSRGEEGFRIPRQQWFLLKLQQAYQLPCEPGQEEGKVMPAAAPWSILNYIADVLTTVTRLEEMYQASSAMYTQLQAKRAAAMAKAESSLQPSLSLLASSELGSANAGNTIASLVSRNIQMTRAERDAIMATIDAQVMQTLNAMWQLFMVQLGVHCIKRMTVVALRRDALLLKKQTLSKIADLKKKLADDQLKAKVFQAKIPTIYRLAGNTLSSAIDLTTAASTAGDTVADVIELTSDSEDEEEESDDEEEEGDLVSNSGSDEDDDEEGDESDTDDESGDEEEALDEDRGTGRGTADYNNKALYDMYAVPNYRVKTSWSRIQRTTQMDTVPGIMRSLRILEQSGKLDCCKTKSWSRTT